MKASTPWILGEVLFDCFQSGHRVLGGAPFNVAWHLAGLGADPIFLSAVGKDEAGDAILARMHARGLTSNGVQQTSASATGRVDVLNEDTEPEYHFPEESAWDCFEMPDTDSLESPTIFYQGSLFIRRERSRTVSMALAKKVACPRFVDVNLRSPWYEPARIRDLVRGIHCLKVSEDELGLLAQWHGIDKGLPIESLAEKLSVAASIEHIFVTKGANGASWFTSGGEQYDAPAVEVDTFVDSVGAGDASAAIALLGLTNGWPVPLLLKRAMFFAAGICRIQGAIPSEETFYEDVSKTWDTTS